MNVFLIHGPDSVQIQTERLKILEQLIPADQRDENLTEFEPSGNRALVLNSLLPNLLAELGTMSFFPGAKRVVVVNELSDFWASEKEGAAEGERPVKGRKKKAAASPTSATAKPGAAPADERLIRYFERDLESTGNAVIFTVLEDPDKRRTVKKSSPLAKWIQGNGHVTAFEPPKPIAWRIGDVVRDRDLNAALGIFREAYRKGKTDQAMAIHRTILTEVRMLLQAKIAAAAGRQLSQAFVTAELLPADERANLYKIHEFRRKNYVRAAGRFTTTQLTDALKDLYEINRYLLPSSADLYVADVGFLMERLLIRLCSRTA